MDSSSPPNPPSPPSSSSSTGNWTPPPEGAPLPSEQSFRPRHAPAKRGMKGWEKGLLTCGIGCLAILVALVVGSIFGVRWLMGGDQVATASIVGEGSVGAFQVEEPLKDDGLRDLLVFLLAELQRVEAEQSAEEMPAFMRQLQDMNRANQAQSNEHSLGMLVPTEITLTLEPLDGALLEAELDGQENAEVQRRGLVAAINLAAFSRTLRLVLEGKGSEVREYRGEKISNVDGDFYLCFYGDTLLLSGDHQPLEAVLDRLLDGAAAGGTQVARDRENSSWPAGSPMTSPLVPSLRGGYDLYGAVTNEGDAQGNWIQSLELMMLRALGTTSGFEWIQLPQAATAGVEEVFVGIDIESADSGRLDLAFACTDADAAGRWRQRLAALLATPPEWGEEVDLRLTPEVFTEGTVVRATLAGTGLRQALGQMMRQAVEEGAGEYDYEDGYEYEDGYDYEDGSSSDAGGAEDREKAAAGESSGQ